MGGSARAMANQIVEGYILVSLPTFRKYKTHELKALEVEIERLAREIRSENPPLDDQPALQKRNRKLGRLKQTQMIIKTAKTVR